MTSNNQDQAARWGWSFQGVEFSGVEIWKGDLRDLFFLRGTQHDISLRCKC